MPFARPCQNPLCGTIILVKPSMLKSGRGKYCSRLCKQICTPTYKALEARFWEKVRVCSHGRFCADCCWEWQGAKHRSGHGMFSIKRDGVWRHIGAHAQAWILLHEKPLPEGMLALHRCNAAGCVNGHHIYPGTKSDNARDALAYGSMPHHKHIHGEAVCTAKLQETDIPIIRQLRTQGLFLRQISEQFGVSIAVIHKIVHRMSWQHVP